jgi:hypothetical protein
MLFLAMLSLGTFGYYLGRAVESNFVVILFPFLLLAGLLADEMIVLVRDGRVPPAAWIYLVPSLAMLAWWTVLPAVGLPAMVASGMKEIDAWRNPARPPVEAAAAFIESKARPGEPGYILSRQNGFLYYLTGVVNPVRMAGLVELFYETDLDELVGALNRGAIPKLFVDTDFFTPPLYRPEVNQRLRQAIALHYRAVATDATGRLTYLTPLSSSP